MWGWNKHGQLGDGSIENLLKPTLVELPATPREYLSSRNSIHHISPSFIRNSELPSSSWVAVTSSNNDRKIKSASLGWRHTIVLAKNGKLYGWGMLKLTTHSNYSVNYSISTDIVESVCSTDDVPATSTLQKVILNPTLLEMPFRTVKATTDNSLAEKPAIAKKGQKTKTKETQQTSSEPAIATVLKLDGASCSALSFVAVEIDVTESTLEKKPVVSNQQRKKSLQIDTGFDRSLRPDLRINTDGSFARKTSNNDLNVTTTSTVFNYLQEDRRPFSPVHKVKNLTRDISFSLDQDAVIDRFRRELGSLTIRSPHHTLLTTDAVNNKNKKMDWELGHSDDDVLSIFSTNTRQTRKSFASISSKVRAKEKELTREGIDTLFNPNNALRLKIREQQQEQEAKEAIRRRYGLTFSVAGSMNQRNENDGDGASPSKQKRSGIGMPKTERQFLASFAQKHTERQTQVHLLSRSPEPGERKNTFDRGNNNSNSKPAPPPYPSPNKSTPSYYHSPNKGSVAASPSVAAHSPSPFAYSSKLTGQISSYRNSPIPSDYGSPAMHFSSMATVEAAAMAARTHFKPVEKSSPEYGYAASESDWQEGSVAGSNSEGGRNRAKRVDIDSAMEKLRMDLEKINGSTNSYSTKRQMSTNR